MITLWKAIYDPVYSEGAGAASYSTLAQSAYACFGFSVTMALRAREHLL